MLELLFQLIAIHFICDYPLQSEAIALGKNRVIDKARFGVSWLYWLSSHAFTHGMAVYLVTGSVMLGIAETVLHGVIDAGKCEGWYGIHIDQLLHLACKLAWLYIIIS